MVLEHQKNYLKKSWKKSRHNIFSKTCRKTIDKKYKMAEKKGHFRLDKESKKDINSIRHFLREKSNETKKQYSVRGGVQMNKAELVATMAEQAGLSKKVAEEALKGIHRCCF